jgi:hypothetical protein
MSHGQFDATLKGVESVAKLTAKQIKSAQERIPEKYRPMMKVSDCGTKIFVTLCLDRFVEVLLRKTHAVKVDRLDFIPEQFKENHEYGFGRRCRDGANTKDSKGKTLNAKDKKQAEELLQHAIAHCDTRLDVMRGKAIQRKAASGVSSTVRCVLRLFKQFACKNLDDDAGKRYTAKTLPSSLLNAKTLEEAVAEAERIGMPANKIKAQVKRGTAIAALEDDDSEMDIDLDEVSA